MVTIIIAGKSRLSSVILNVLTVRKSSRKKTNCHDVKVIIQGNIRRYKQIVSLEKS